MRGQVLGVDARTRLGQIAGDDGRRYGFEPDDWHDVAEPARGARVDFEVDGDRALNIFREPREPGVPVAGVGQSLAAPGDRNRYIAALIAFALGAVRRSPLLPGSQRVGDRHAGADLHAGGRARQRALGRSWTWSDIW